MAHFVRIEDGIVREVIVVRNCETGGCIGPDHPDYVAEQHEACGALDFPASEPIGQAFIASIGLTGEWLQTSYSGTFRGKYAGQGDTYDEANDVFVSPVVEAPAE